MNDVLLETAFGRLLSRYERIFGEPPPFTAATADEVVAHMRRRLREADGAAAALGPPGWLHAAARDADGAGAGRASH
jgi:hypothetical protein